jgi:hypothetical protein
MNKYEVKVEKSFLTAVKHKERRWIDNGSKEKSCSKEDRKEEISFPENVHTFFGWRRNSPAFLFAVFLRHETQFYKKMQAHFYNILKNRDIF